MTNTAEITIGCISFKFLLGAITCASSLPRIDLDVSVMFLSLASSVLLSSLRALFLMFSFSLSNSNKDSFYIN